MHSVQNVSVNLGTIGELCAAECQLENGQVILLVSLYIHVNKKIDDIIYFIHKILLPYTMAGSELLGQHDHQIPMILSGDFNVNFAEERSKTLISFLKEKLNLNMVNDCEVPRTRCGTTIDAVFHRYLDRLECRSFFTYFSYHKALVSFLENESNNDNDNAENQM